MNKLKLALVSFGFLGCSPFAPGTAGTLGGVLVAWAISRTGALYPYCNLAICIGLYAVGAALGPWSERYAGRKDPGIFVVDEVIGYLITVLWVRGPSPVALLVAFFVFRFFDIVKPAPARRMEKIPGGHGILLDDVVAGLYGWLFVMLPGYLLFEQWTVGGQG